MCTPDNIPPFCSCPHLLWRDLRAVIGAVALAVVAAGLWAVVASGYAWALGVAAWLVVMAGAAQVSVSRRRRAELTAARATRAAAATRTGTAVSRPRPTARPPRRTRAPGAPSPDRLPAWGARS